MLPSFIQQADLPKKPGVYLFKDSGGLILYVGKAINLASRVSQYFSGRSSGSFKTSALVEKIRSVETIIVESELEALILEANLIKKYLPPYNIRLTDDKDYLYIAITKEAFPKVITARKKDLKEVRSFFGPFPSAKTVRDTLKQLRRVFPWCSNPPGPRNRRFRPCFYYHLEKCPGACVGAISQKDYHQIISRFIFLLEGKTERLLAELTDEMLEYSSKQQFEEAAKIRRILSGMQYLLQPNRASHYLENPNFLAMQNQLALEQLQQALKLPSLPERIEAYDISNIQGQQATGSMVVLTNGEIDKSQYRRFKIKISGKPNDYAMHAEMMQRRLKNDWPLPDLFLIDGGRGQVRAVWNVVASSEKGITNIPIYGIAKRMEWLYPPEGEVIKLPRNSLALRLLQKIRDESHRFAISYYRKLHRRSFLPTAN